MNYKGQVCRPGRYSFSMEEYGPGISAVQAYHGILVCGGQNNIWYPDKVPNGGKVSWVHKYVKVYQNRGFNFSVVFGVIEIAGVKKCKNGKIIQICWV